MTASVDKNKINDELNNKYEKFDKAIENSVLENKFLSEKDLLKKGFIKSEVIDKNGGTYYKKDDEIVRIMDQRLLGDGKSVTYKNNDMTHFVTYDTKGKETGGIVQLKQPDGSIKIYEYDVDIEGNKFIKSIKTSEFDYFGDYE